MRLDSELRLPWGLVRGRKQRRELMAAELSQPLSFCCIQQSSNPGLLPPKRGGK